MSAVTAAILIGSTPRVGAGIMPRWVAMLHEGSSYAWHLLRLQMSVGELGDNSRDDPPGVLWRASAQEDIAGELALLLHMYAARTPEIVQLTRRIRHIQRRRVDLSGLQGVELTAFENALRVARDRGRELRLAAQILPGSRLTDDHLLSLPDWELEVCYSAFSRDWTHADGGRLVIREHSSDDEEAGFTDLTVLDDHDDEFLDDSDAHAIAEHPRHAVSARSGDASRGDDGERELVDGAGAQATAARHVADAVSDDARSTGAGGVPTDGAGSDLEGEDGRERESAYVNAPGAASAWLEREGEPAHEGRSRSLFDRWRFTR